MLHRAILYDGASGDRREVDVEPGSGEIVLHHADGRAEAVKLGKLQALDAPAGALRIGRSDVPGWRLTLGSEAADALRPMIGRPERYGGWVDRFGLVPAAAAFAAVAVAVVAIGYSAPQWVAPHVPSSWERNLGSAIVGDFGDRRCRNEEGQQALEALVERLQPGALSGETPVRIAALDVPMFNAAALPGGHIVVFKPMITETENVEALAGVLAHELAHVRRRHVTEALIREMGIGALIRLFAGSIGANAQQLVSLSYTREHEAEADADAIEMLRSAGISPVPVADLFDRLAEDEEQGRFSIQSEFLESHPPSRERAHRFRAASGGSAGHSPALTRDQEDALFSICGEDPSAEDSSAG